MKKPLDRVYEDVDHYIEMAIHIAEMEAVQYTLGMPEGPEADWAADQVEKYKQIAQALKLARNLGRCLFELANELEEQSQPKRGRHAQREDH